MYRLIPNVCFVLIFRFCRLTIDCYRMQRTRGNWLNLSVCTKAKKMNCSSWEPDWQDSWPKVPLCYPSPRQVPELESRPRRPQLLQQKINCPKPGGKVIWALKLFFLLFSPLLKRAWVSSFFVHFFPVCSLYSMFCKERSKNIHMSMYSFLAKSCIP